MIRRAFLLASMVTIATACSREPRPSHLLAPMPDHRAPEMFNVAFETSKGQFVVQAVRSWAPRGVDRFHYLASIGYFDGVKFFRVLPDFVAQFGMHGDSAVNATWRSRRIPDDSVRQSNQDGYVTFAKGGPNTRTTQMFINKRDNRRLDTLGFAPIGRVVTGSSVVHALYSGYGEGPPRGAGPSQELIAREGNRYLNRAYPRLDSIIRARVVKD